ncbi:hypothetical protein [Mycoplasma phocimorsus]|uniref:hypothetical protein n=1 Tax=Mycoplasma phocimorsus TaxID=3045839 RepID=UPI0024C014FE|nr:hypothetical protein [Mycoplasma phocimorsus]MDJ1647301.1 hypothetical protein [Mycoplasma phocimorsus]
MNKNISKMLFKNEAIYLDYLIINFDKEDSENWGLHVWEDGFKYAYRTTENSFTETNKNPSNNKEQSFGSLPEWNENNWKFKNKKIVFKNINIKQISEFVIHKENGKSEKSFDGGNLKWPINDMLKIVNKGGATIAEYWVKKGDYKVYADKDYKKAVN